MFQIFVFSLIVVGCSAGGKEVRCTKEHFSSALTKSATCRPREKVIRLDPPGNMTVETMTPLYISVKKCGGACGSQSQSCVPTKQRKREVPVIIGSCGVESGICDKQCYQLEVMEDIDCHCNCLEEQKNCGEGKVFMSDSCECRCKDRDAAKQCRDSGRVWNTGSCSCGCPLHTVVPCSSGLSFDNETCTCADLIIREDRQTQVEPPEARVPRSHQLLGNIEYVIIAVLSGVLLIFIFVTAVLIRTVTVLRTKLDTKTRFDPGPDASYVRCTNPLPDDSKSYISQQEKYEQMGLLAELRGSSCVESKLSAAPVSSKLAAAPMSSSDADACAVQNQQLLAESPVYSSIQRVGGQHGVREAATSPKAGLCLASFQDDPYTKLLDEERQDKSNSIDSNDSNPESGFDSSGGSGSTKSDDLGHQGYGEGHQGYGDGHHTTPRKLDHLAVHVNPNDSLSVLSNTLVSNHSTSNPSVYSIVSRETPV